jgi:hypothetical protein
MNLLWILSDASALFLLWLFGSAALNKLKTDNRLYYQTVLSGYGIDHVLLAKLLPASIGLLELALGLLMVIPASRGYAAIAAIALLAGYATAFSVQLLQGKAGIDCGCAGPAGDIKLSGHLLVRNLLLMALAIGCLLPAQGLGLGYWSLVSLSALLLVLLYLCTEQLLGNAQKLTALANY